METEGCKVVAPNPGCVCDGVTFAAQRVVRRLPLNRLIRSFYPAFSWDLGLYYHITICCIILILTEDIMYTVPYNMSERTIAIL